MNLSFISGIGPLKYNPSVVPVQSVPDSTLPQHIRRHCRRKQHKTCRTKIQIDQPSGPVDQVERYNRHPRASRPAHRPPGLPHRPPDPSAGLFARFDSVLGTVSWTASLCWGAELKVSSTTKVPDLSATIKPGRRNQLGRRSRC